MKTNLLLFCALLLVGMQSVYSKTPAQLTADFATVLPAGTSAKMCWVQAKTLYVVNSADGNVRRLLTTSVDADWPNVTADGSKVVFYDMAANTVNVIDWNGSNLKTLKTEVPSDEVTVEYWVDAAGVDWVIAGGGSCGLIRRFKLSDPTVCVTLWNKSGEPIPSHGDGLGLSEDGTRLAAMVAHSRPDYNNGAIYYSSGIMQVPAGGGAGEGFANIWIGCGISMLPGNSYTASIGAGNSSQEDPCVLRVVDGPGNIKASYSVNQAVSNWEAANGGMNTCHEYEQFRNQRWSNNIDIVCFSSFNTKRNPWVYNVKTNKFFGVVDNLNCTETGHADLVVLGKVAVAPKKIVKATDLSNATSTNMYTLNGKMIAPGSYGKNAKLQSILLVKGQNSGSSTLNKVLISK